MNEPKQPKEIKCEKCKSPLIWYNESVDMYFSSSDYVEDSHLCRCCIEDEEEDND